MKKTMKVTATLVLKGDNDTDIRRQEGRAWEWVQEEIECLEDVSESGSYEFHGFEFYEDEGTPEEVFVATVSEPVTRPTSPVMILREALTKLADAAYDHLTGCNPNGSAEHYNESVDRLFKEIGDARTIIQGFDGWE